MKNIAEKLYKLEVPYWMKKAGLGVLTGALALSTACSKPDEPEDEPDEPTEVVGNNIEIPFARADLAAANVQQLTTKVQNALNIVPAVDTVFLVAQGDWDTAESPVMLARANSLEDIKDLDADRIWGRGIINPASIGESDSIRLALMKFIIDAKVVFPGL